MSKILLTFEHDRPDTFDNVNIYRSLEKGEKGKFVKSLHRNELEWACDKYGCYVTENKPGTYYYSISLSNRFGESECQWGESVEIPEQTKVMEDRINTIFDQSIRQFWNLEKAITKKYSQKFSYLKWKVKNR